MFWTYLARYSCRSLVHSHFGFWTFFTSSLKLWHVLRYWYLDTTSHCHIRSQMINNGFRSFPTSKQYCVILRILFLIIQTSFNLREKQDSELEKYRVFDSAVQFNWKLKPESKLKANFQSPLTVSGAFEYFSAKTHKTRKFYTPTLQACR